MARIEPPNPLPDLVAMTATAQGSAPVTILALAHCESLLGPFIGWAAALTLKGALTRRDHEILALRTAHNCSSEFEWTEHSRFAHAAGLTDEEIDRVATGAEAGWSRKEELLIVAADELYRYSSISSRIWKDLTRFYTTSELIEATYVVGQYTMLSMVANVATAEDGSE